MASKSLWLRLYTEVLNDPKVQRLDGDTFKGWVNLLCVAKESSGNGTLPTLSDIAFYLRTDANTAGQLVQRLIEAGLIDYDGERYVMHGWNQRQYESDNDPTATERKRRERDRKRDVTDNVTDTSRVTSRMSHGQGHANVTRTETDTETDTDIDTDIDNNIVRKRFKKPTIADVQAYCAERGNVVDPQKFIDYYESNGWRVGKNPMKDWRAAVRTWERNNQQVNSKVLLKPMLDMEEV